MVQYLRPGAYTEHSDAAQSNRLLLRSDVPAFVGIAEKGPLDTPIPIESFRQFQAWFGGFIGAGYLAYSVRGFFDNGGRRCWVNRVASRSFDEHAGLAAQVAGTSINDVNGRATWSIEAFSEGSWGNGLQVALLEESNADVSIVAGGIQAFYCQVSSTAGFVRGSLVRITQEDSSGSLREFVRVLSYVDAQNQRLYWVHPEPGEGLVYDQALEGHDSQSSARITTISYRIDVYDSTGLLAMYSDLSLIPEHANYAPLRLASLNSPSVNSHSTRESYYSDANDQGRVAEVPEPITVIDLRQSQRDIPQGLQITALQKLELTGGQDGLQELSHKDFMGEDFSPQDSDQQREQKSRGIAVLEQVDEITLLAVPDIVIQAEEEVNYELEPPAEINPCLRCPPPPEKQQAFTPPERSSELPPVFSDEQVYQVQAAMVEHCEKRGDRLALIDPPYHIASDETEGIASIRAWRSRFDSSYAALYYPWVKVVDPRSNGSVRSIPPSGHALGQYALFDTETGVHRAPANRALQWIQDLSLHTTYGQQEMFNPLSINVLRSEGPRGIRIMGARTLSSDPDWKYINVRRLLIMIRRTLDIISQWVVFEPNNFRTRNKFQVAISSYLFALWSRGALSGSTQEQAFFVKCDEENNPGQQRNNGQLLAEVGVAPSNPFEFVIVRVGVQENELKVSETTATTTTS